MSFEGQDHHPHRRGYPPSPDLLLESHKSVPPGLELVQAHWFTRHGERAPVRQRMVGLGDIPAVFSLCTVGRHFTSAVLTLSPSNASSQTSSSLRSSPSPSNPFLSTTRHTTTHSSSPPPESASTPPYAAPLDPNPFQLPVTRLTQNVASSDDNTTANPSLPTRGGLSDCYWGELTDLGRESTLRFGSILREVYTSPSSSSSTPFLPRELDTRMLNEGVVQFRSTNMPRTIESLHQIITGLWPVSARNPRDENFPIHFMVRNWMDENLYPNAVCKRLRQLDVLSIAQAAKTNNPDLAQFDKDLKDVFGLEKGLRIDSSPRASGVLDTLMVCRAHGIRVPEVFEERRVLEGLERAVVHEWFDGYNNPEFKRLAMGRLLSDLHGYLSLKIAQPEKEKLKLSINSCHDTSLGGILNALDAFNGRWPAFTSHIGIELYKSPSPAIEKPAPTSPDTRHFVRVLYNGRLLSLPGCASAGNHLEGTEGKVCTWEAFKGVLDKVKMSEKEWKEACGNTE
ncbi:uncharacterized protein JCM6883_003623 [Sporobolomyces salmoneus]|uniref:uncharacterized protein n=1 Tax=Sporobolomyces salmoneus TaxID=183962 RepID=UPI00318145E7